MPNTCATMFSIANMPFFSNESPPRLLSNHCKFLPCFARRPPQCKLPCSLCKFLSTFTGDLCNGRLCFRPLCSEEESSPYNFDNKVIIWEIQRRALKIKESRTIDYKSSDSLSWVLSPITGELIIAPKVVATKVDDESDDDEATETFYSVRSYLSQCSSGGSSKLKETQGQTIWDEFRHCEGWPFGLHRRGVHVTLPPLPRSPSDSWTWRKRSPTVQIWRPK